MSKLCDCFDRMLEQVKEKQLKSIDLNRVVEGSINTEWQNKTFFLSSGDHLPVTFYIDTDYKLIKKDGTPAKNKSKLRTGVIMSYCPFCGVAYGDSPMKTARKILNQK